MKPEQVGRTGGFHPVAAQEDISGLMAQSIILTQKGETRVDAVKPGDRVITRDCGLAVVTSVRSREITTRAVQIKAGSIGHTRPERDTILPAGQPILIRDWRARAVFGAKQSMVPAECLVDGEFITLCGSMAMTVYELEFDTPHVLYVDGLEVASHSSEVTHADAA